MAKVSKVFKAIDDSEHPTEAAAEKHNKYVEAVAAFHDAGEAVKKAMLDKALTGEGKPFDSRHTEWYHVSDILFIDGPYVQRVYIWPWNMHVDVENDRICLREYSHRNGHGDYTTYHADDLYMSEEAANEEVKHILGERLERLQQRLAE